MIFRDTQAQLQANNLCRFEKPYSQAVVTPSDINLQGRLPMQGANDYDIQINLFDCTGNVFIADVTEYFRILFATSIYNFRYFNLQLREFSEDFPTCFTLQVKVTNNSQLIFNKITESYKRLFPDKRCYVEISEEEWDVLSANETLIVNGENSYSITDLPNHFEPLYQQGTETWHLYFDCEEVATIGIGDNENVALALPLSASLGGYSQAGFQLLPIYAIYIIDETGCRLPYKRIESTYNCLDNISGLYYGDAKQLLNYEFNDENLKYSNTQWIESEIKKLPTEIKKEVSFLGRTQRVDYTPMFSYRGLLPFPQWKVDEIEATFSGKRLFIDAVEFILREGEIFKKDTIRCTCNYLLDAKIEQYVITNEFSCVDDCNTLCYYFVIPAGMKDQAYYDENGQLIGLLFQDLLDYFNALPDVISVTDYVDNTLECQPTAVIQIDSFGFVPSFIYYFELTPTNKIYVKRDDCTDPETLCEGLGSCIPSQITSVCESTCPPPFNITSTCEEMNMIQGAITPQGDWTLNSGFTAEVDEGGDVNLAFVMENTSITDPTILEVVNEFVGVVSNELRPISVRIIDDANKTVLIYPDGSVFVTAYVLVEDGVKATLTIPVIHYHI